jgi:hypothetical protein
MLEAVLEAVRRAVEDYTQRARQADGLGDKGWLCSSRTWSVTRAATLRKPSACCRDWPV